MTLSSHRGKQPAGWSDPDDSDDLDFQLALRARTDDGGMRKGERTRLAIQIAACEILEKASFSAFKVQDLCQRTGIAQGTFYIYFSDRNDLVNRLLEDFVEFVQDRMIMRARQTAGDPARASTKAYFQMFERNRGLMKCLLSYYEEFPDARAILHKMNRGWIATVVAAAKRKLAAEGRTGSIGDDELFRRAYALGGMVDQYLSSLFLYEDENVAAVSRDREAVTDTLTFIWKRTMTAER